MVGRAQHCCSEGKRSRTAAPRCAAEFELAVQFLDAVIWALDAALLPQRPGLYNASDLAAECVRRREDRATAAAATRTRIQNMSSYPVLGNEAVDGRLFVDELCTLLDVELQMEGAVAYPPANVTSVLDLYRCGSPGSVKDKHTLVRTAAMNIACGCVVDSVTMSDVLFLGGPVA